MPTVHPSLREQAQLKFVSARINQYEADAVLKFANLNALNAQSMTKFPNLGSHLVKRRCSN